MDEGVRRDLLLVHRMTPLLEVQDLHVTYYSRTGEAIPALAGLSFDLRPGEILGVLGESGSGKSTLGAALVRLLSANGKIEKGTVTFEGQNLLRATPRELERIRGGRIALIFQEPSLALHPTLPASAQVSDVLAAHESLSRKALREKTLQLFADLFPDAESRRIADSYPHQLSGGQRQRVLLAQAIACSPSLIVADEPTASLDPITQQEILSLFRTLRLQLNLSIILITHNPALLVGLADRVLVMYAGRVAEIGPTRDVLSSPRHPYTRALLRCLPSPFDGDLAGRKMKLPLIPGELRRSTQLTGGCEFEPRCTERMDVCTRRAPALVALSEAHHVSCFKYGG